MKSLPYENSFRKKNFDIGNGDAYDPNVILDYYEKGNHFNEYFGDDGKLKYPGHGFDHSPLLADEPTHGTAAPLNYVEPPNLPPLGPTPPLNHYVYQYPHAKLPASSTAVSENSSYYHLPLGQGFPFKEEQQLPSFHFQEESKFEKLPLTVSSNASQTLQSLPPFSVNVSRVSTSQVVSGLSPTAPITVSIPSLNTKKAHTSQASSSLPPYVIASRVNFLSPMVTQATSSTVLSADSSNAQLKNSSQRPTVIKITHCRGKYLLLIIIVEHCLCVFH